MSKVTTVCLLTDERVHAVALALRGRRWEVLAQGSLDYLLPDSLHSAAFTDALAAGTADATASAITATVDECDQAGRSITLILPLQWCFTQTLATEGKRTNTDALTFEFEQHLPMPVESLTCAFAALGRAHVMAAAIPTLPMKHLLGALSERGIEVLHIGIDALTASLDTKPSSRMILDTRWGRMLCHDGDSDQWATSLFGVGEASTRGGAIRDAMKRCRPTDGNGTTSLSVFDLADRGGGADGNGKPNADNVTQFSGEDALAELARAAAGSAMLDLRTGPLAAEGRWARPVRLVQHCLVLCMALAVVWIAGLYLHQHSIKRELAVVHEAKRAAYGEVFGEGAMPPGAALRMASELVRLKGLTRQGGPGSESVSESLKALPVLRNVVASLPPDVRVMLIDARIDAKQMTLRGQTAAHRDAERIVEAINRVPGLSARPPRTTRLDRGGVEFSIIAAVRQTNGS